MSKNTREHTLQMALDYCIAALKVNWPQDCQEAMMPMLLRIQSGDTKPGDIAEITRLRNAFMGLE